MNINMNLHTITVKCKFCKHLDNKWEFLFMYYNDDRIFLDIFIQLSSQNVYIKPNCWKICCDK